MNENDTNKQNPEPASRPVMPEKKPLKSGQEILND